MYTGQVDQISNKATWISETIELYDDSDGTTTDLSAVSPLEIEVTIKDLNNCTLVTGTIDDGKVLVPGPGFYWRFEDTDLCGVLCAGTYKLGVKITMNDTVIDEIVGTVAVIEGN